MCVQYCGGVQYRGDDIMMHVGNILSTAGMFSTVRGYLEYRGGVQCLGITMSTVGGVILSTVGYIMTHMEGYHEYRGGCSVPWEKNLLLFEYPHGTEHPMVLMISPTFIMISLTVLNIPTVLKISLQMHHDIPTVLNIPPRY